jgi:hypothetical protein
VTLGADEALNRKFNEGIGALVEEIADDDAGLIEDEGIAENTQNKMLMLEPEISVSEKYLSVVYAHSYAYFYFFSYPFEVPVGSVSFDLKTGERVDPNTLVPAGLDWSKAEFYRPFLFSGGYEDETTDLPGYLPSGDAVMKRVWLRRGPRLCAEFVEPDGSRAVGIINLDTP